MKKRALIATFIVIATVVAAGVFVALHSRGSSRIQDTSVMPTAEEISPAAIYNDVNEQRHLAGAPLLSPNAKATQAAQEKCQDMVDNDYYAHVNPKTGKHGYMYTVALIPEGAVYNENLNQGYPDTNESFVDSWMNSPDHKATMLDPEYTDTGVAVCRLPSTPDQVTIVQEFVKIPPPQPAQTPANCKSRIVGSYYPTVRTTCQ